ncbi:MAG: hypothetical protein C0478_14675 [Planctomyces sp.]|nr:hypothetical protein [Planctomyces sp.]
MPFEIVCEACQNPLLVEESGVVVECPECGAHLEIQDEAHDEPTIDTSFDFSTLTATTPDAKATNPQKIDKPGTSPPPSEFGFLSSLQTTPTPLDSLSNLHFPAEAAATSLSFTVPPEHLATLPAELMKATTQSPPVVSEESINLDFLKGTPAPLPPANVDLGLASIQLAEPLPVAASLFDLSVPDQIPNHLSEVAVEQDSLVAPHPLETSVPPELILVTTSIPNADEMEAVPAGFPLPDLASTLEAGMIEVGAILGKEGVVPDPADPSTDEADDVHFAAMEAEHFSRSSPQLAELIRQTAVAGHPISSGIQHPLDPGTTADDTLGTSGEVGSDDKPAITESSAPLSQPAYDDMPSSPGSSPPAENDIDLSTPELRHVPAVDPDLVAQHLAGFSKAVQPLPSLEDLTGVAPSPSGGKTPAARVESGDFSFGKQPVAVDLPESAPLPADRGEANDLRLPQEDVVSRQLFLMVLGYASAATLALLFFIVQYLRLPYHQLESLPDIKPPATGISVKLIDPDNGVAPLHTLRIGEHRRFGNIEVTPLGVSRGPVVVTQADPQKTALPSEPVLKLHLRFRNVSENQTIVPLDRELVFFKEGRFGGRSNQFIKRDGVSAKETGVVRLFDIPIRSPESIENMPLGVALAPGESVETFLPSDTGGIDELEGQLIWRLQFRKGQNPQSGNPVTTLVDVKFDADSIERVAAAG